MVQHGYFASLVRPIMALCTAGLLLLTSSGWPGADAQVTPPPVSARQPKAADVPKDSSQKRSPEDLTLERALNNICRGCNPTIRVRDVPRYDPAHSCPPTSDQDNDRCRKDEQTVRQRLQDQWTQFTEKARSDCVQTNEIGGRPSYVQLGICLKATQIAPTLPEGQ